MTSNTLARAGNVLNTDSTTIFKPSFLLITLRGRKALNALTAFNDFKAFECANK